MFKLTVFFNGEQIMEQSFETDSVTVGRSSECDMVIDNAGVSRKHCKVVKQGKFYILQDMNSNNGTFVGGQLISGPHVLNSGEEIGLGKHILRFQAEDNVDDDEDEDDGDQEDAPRVFDAASGAMTMQVDAADMIKMQIQRQAKVKGYLTFKKGASGRRPVKLEKAFYVLGSWDKADIPVTGFGVPAKAAIIIREEVNYRILNFARVRPVRVNDTKIDDKVLNNGDLIQIGGLVIEFRAGDPTA